MKHAAAALFATMAALAGCGDESGALVEVVQAPAIQSPVDVLHLYVGVDLDATGSFLGSAQDGDVITLDAPLSERTHTIRLVRSAEMTGEQPVRLVVVGSISSQGGDVEVGIGVLDLPRLPSDVMLRYQVELQPIGQVVTTDTGCVITGDGVLVSAKDDHDCDDFTPEAGDCDDGNPGINPDAYDACEGGSLGVDDDCNDTADDGDQDGDDATCQRDCDDEDPERTPNAIEDCENGVDNDCDDEIDEGVPERCMNGVDDDCDNTTPDDGLPEEICADGADNDCDLEIDEGRTVDGGVLDGDVDGDGATCATDCDDDNEDVLPGAVETCNQTDDNCDGAQDEGVNEDLDSALCINDCDDEDPTAFPGGTEICDQADNDCVEATHPAPSPCFDYETDPCQYGFRACDEVQGLYEPACSPMLTNPVVVAAVCPQFMSCANDPDDRLVCGAQPAYFCTQRVTGSLATVCPGARHPLIAAGDPTTCSWAIIGGRVQQGWTVGLIPSGSTVPVAITSSCEAEFEVQVVPPGLQPGTFAVAAMIDGSYDHTEIFTIAPERNAVCAIPSLLCP